jgi:predicted transcriptional regulator
MAKKAFSVRLQNDLAEQVEKVADERDISESDALRRLVERGVEYEFRLSEMDTQLDRIEKEVNAPLWRRWF